MKRYLAAFVLSLVLAFGIAPGLALASEGDGSLAAGSATLTAQDAATYDLWVGGVEVTSANASNIKGAGVSGKVSYNASTNTLTLNGATITGQHSADSFYYRGDDPVPYLQMMTCGISQSGIKTLTVKLIGTNKLNFKHQGGTDRYGAAIGKSEGKLVFTGSGSLAITGKCRGYNRGILCGDLAIDSNATVKSNISTSLDDCYAVLSKGSITVAGTLSASAVLNHIDNENNGFNAYGVDAGEGITVKKGGKLTAKAQGSRSISSYAEAVDCDGKLTVGGTLSASAKGNAAYGLSISNGGTVTKSGKLIVAAETDWHDYTTALNLYSGDLVVNGTAKVTSNAKGICHDLDPDVDTSATVTVGPAGELVASGSIALENVSVKLGSSKLNVLAGFDSSGAKAVDASAIGDSHYVHVFAPKANTLTVKAKTVKFKVSKVQKKAQSVKASKAFTVKKAKGGVSYKAVKSVTKNAKSKVKVAKNGKVTVKKGTKKGTYKLQVRVTAAGDTFYKKGSKTVTLTVKVVK